VKNTPAVLSNDECLRIWTTLSRGLAAATSPREVALAAFDAIRYLVAADAVYVQVLHEPHGRIESVLVMERTVTGEFEELRGWSESFESATAAAAPFRDEPQFYSVSKGQLWTGRLLGNAGTPVKSALLAPVGRILGHFAQLSVQSYSEDAYKAADVDLLLAVCDLCGDSLYRALAQADPNKSPYALAEENRLLRTMIDTLPDYLYIKDAEGRFILANAALVRSVGAKTLQDVLGKDDSFFAPPELQRQYRADELAVMATGNAMVNREEVVMEASGERVRVHTTKVPLRDSSGKVIGVVGVGHAPLPDTRPANFKRGSAAETAQEAGVSIATVSRAFNGSPLVTEETRRKIFSAARKVGYHPNVAARNLSLGRSDSVAFVLKASHLVGEFYSEVLSGFQAVVRGRGLDVLLSVVPDNVDSTVWLQKLLAGGACSAMAAHYEIFSGADSEILDTLPIPVVIANYVPDDSDPLTKLVTVGFDNRQGVKQVIRHLAALGHTRIAWLGGTSGHRDAVEREAGFREAMKECGLEVRPDWIGSQPFNIPPAHGKSALHNVLSAYPDRPTAIACASDAIAAAAIVAAKEWNQTVPECLSITGFDDLSWARMYSPPLTTVQHSGSELGQAVGQALIARMDNPALGVRRIVLPTHLVVRDSAKPLQVPVTV
jgi:LacI family transcriptional regulator